MIDKGFYLKSSVAKKKKRINKSGHAPQKLGAQEELIGGKPLVVK